MAHDIETAEHDEEETSNDIKLFGQTVVLLSCIFWVIIIILAVICALPIAQIIIGNMYKDNCPINRFVPIYLIVSGSIGLVIIVVHILMACLKSPFCCLCVYIVLSLFNLGWIIAGTVWLSNIRSKVQFDNSNIPTTYCQETVYNFFFATIIIEWAFIVISVCCQRSSQRS